MKPTFLLAPYFVLIILCMGCGDGEDENPNTASFTCKIDGRDFVSNQVESMLMGNQDGRRLDITAVAPSRETINLLISDNEAIDGVFFELDKKIYLDPSQNTALDVVGLGTIFLSETSVAITIGNGKEVGYIMVENFDASRKTVGGSFEFLASNIQTGDSYQITEGKFANLPFSEVETND